MDESKEFSQAQKDEILNRFEYKKPNEKGVEGIVAIREACKVAAKLIVDTCQPSRETSLAITKLEEVSMWANKAVAFQNEATA